jgi:transposase
MRKRNWDKEEQRLIVLEILKGAKTVSQVAKEHGISDSLVYRWRDQALQGISEAFDNKKRNNQINSNAERDPH